MSFVTFVSISLYVVWNFIVEEREQKIFLFAAGWNQKKFSLGWYAENNIKFYKIFKYDLSHGLDKQIKKSSMTILS